MKKVEKNKKEETIVKYSYLILQQSIKKNKETK